MLPALLALAVTGAGLMSMPGTAGAQVTDPRVMQLEEQLRQLTGQIEELNFQILQMQEQMRRQQEDYEYRFQQLEGGDPQDASRPPANEQGAIEAGPPERAVAGSAPPAQAGATTAGRVAPEQAASAAAGNDDGRGAPPRNLGTLTLGADGSVRGADVDFSKDAVGAAIDGRQVASITGAMDPEELYRTGYGHVLDGDYTMAEELFRSFVELYPDDILTPDARFWLGESVLAQGRYEDAAQIFIDTRARHPDAQKAPETMLKIGTIMAALGNRDLACVTFDDALATHSDMAPALRQRIADERAKARC